MGEEEEEEERGSNEGPVGNQEKWVGGRVKEALRRLQERQVDEYLLQSGCQTKMEIESSTQQLRSKWIMQLTETKKKSSVSTKTCSFTTRFTVCLIKTQIQTDSSSWKHKSHMFGLKTLFFFFHRKIKGPLLYTDRKTQNKSAQHRPRAHENQQNVKIHSHGRRIRCSFSRCSCFPRHVTSVRVPRSWPRAPRISHPGAFLIRCLKKKSRYPAGLDLARAFQLPAKTLPPRVSCCCWRRRTPLCDCRKWREVKWAQISAERSCSSLKRRRGVKFKFPPWMPKVFFKSSLLQCYITVCGKHQAAVKETQQRRLLQHEASASWIVHISIPYFFSSFAFRNKRTFYTSGNDLYLRLTVSKSHESTKTNRK